MGSFSVDIGALGSHNSRVSASPFDASAGGAARLVSLHQPPHTCEALIALCERLTVRLLGLRNQIDDIAAATHSAADAYGQTETAILDRLTVLDPG